MATQIDDSVLLQFIRTSDEVAEKLKNGATTLVVPMAAIAPLGPAAVKALQKRIDESITARFTIAVDEAVNAVTISAVESMPLSGPALPARKRKDAAKVPRPKNAFMIYRLDWHSHIAAEHPGMHNNDISKIIGAKWRAESQDIIDTYKAKAEEEKRQHAIDHPGYQYQPRKPSEKKKRMTKNKQAKLAAQFNDPTASAGPVVVAAAAIAPAPAVFVPAVAANQASINTFVPPFQNNASLPPSALLDPFNGFDAMGLFGNYIEQERQDEFDMGMFVDLEGEWIE